MNQDELLDKLQEAIARQEGFGAGFNRATNNNNPGNLWDGVYPGKSHRIWPDIPIDDEGFLIYGTAYEGFAALRHDLRLKIYRGMTLHQVVYAWAPAEDPRNDPATYLKHVAEWTGLPTDKPLKELA